jgi:transposase
VHKATISVALAEGGRGGEVRQLGVFENRPEVVTKLAARLGKDGRRLSFCYEAGPCGYGLHRLLTGCGHDCVVVAPSLIPIKAGDRVKTDRRDALMLAKLHRAGELTPIWIPDAAHEAMRDLVRGRERRRGRCCRRRVSTCKGFCCGTSGFTAAPAPGRSPTGAG